MNKKKRVCRTKVFAALQDEWNDIIALSPLYKKQLREWRKSEPALADCWDGTDVVHFGLSPNSGEACKVLEALARIAQKPGDNDRLCLASRTAIQILLPRLAALSQRGKKWITREQDRVALTLFFAHEAIRTYTPGFQCDSQGNKTKSVVSTPYDFRLWSNIKSRIDTVIKQHIIYLRTEQPAPLLEGFASARRNHDETRNRLGPYSEENVASLKDLVNWVTAIADLSETDANLVVLSRVAGYKMNELADKSVVSVSSLYQRRRRCENRLRSVLAA